MSLLAVALQWEMRNKNLTIEIPKENVIVAHPGYTRGLVLQPPSFRTPEKSKPLTTEQQRRVLQPKKLIEKSQRATRMTPRQLFP